MKRRIIAALTALVMVVTMIPASAFAATSSSVEQVNALIKAADISTNVKYDNKSLVDEAYKAYDSLTTTDKEDVKDKDDLLGAVSLFNLYNEKVVELGEALKGLKAGTVTVSNYDDTVKPVIDAYKYVSGITTLSKDSQTLVVTSDDEVMQGLVGGEVNYKMLTAMEAATTDFSNEARITGPIGRVNTMGKVSDEDISDITADTTSWSGFATAYNNVLEIMDYAEGYIFIAEGYDQFVKANDKIVGYSELGTKVNTLKTTLETGDQVSEVHSLATATDTKGYKAFEKALKDAETVISENGEVLLPEDFSDDRYEAFVEVYEDAKDAYDRYQTRDKVLADIKLLPTSKEIATADYSTLVKYYEQYKAIDDEVALTTVLKTQYETIGDEIIDRYKEFSDSYVADQYADTLLAIINKIPTDVTRANIADVNAAIDVILEYETVTGAADVDVEKTDKLDKDNTLTKLTSTAVSSNKLDKADIDGTALKTALNKKDDAAWTKLVAVSDRIIALADADMAAITTVAQIVSQANGDPVTDLVPATVSGSSENAKTASDTIKKFRDEYAKLNETRKADFEATVKSGADQFKNVYTIIENAEKEIAKMPTAQDYKDAADAVVAMRDLNTMEMENIKFGNTAYNDAVALINKVEGYLVNPAVKKIIVDDTSYNKSYTNYKNRKAEIERMAVDSTAPTAVITAIAGLTILDPTEIDVTESTLDAVITAYETADKMFNELTAAEKAKVTNATRLAEVKEGIVASVEDVFEATVDSIGVWSPELPFTDSQVATINHITQMIDKYEKYVDLTDNASYGDYEDAYKELNDDITDAAEKEYNAIKPVLDIAKTYLGTDSKYVVSKASAKAIIAAAEAYNGMSDAAKTFAEKKNIENNYKLANLLVSYELAKALVLDYATIEVADVDYAGVPATPAVVVKDANGKVVADTEYTVTYSNNEQPGTAKVIVTAKADGNYIGTVSKEFKIIAKELAKVENVKFDTDYGIVRVFFDRTADIDGVDVRYQVQYKKTTSDTWTTKYPTVGYEYLTLKNLTKNGKYDVRVRAYTDDYGTERVYGEYSDVQTVYANRNGAKSGIMYKAVINSLTTKNGSVTVKVNPVKYTSEPTTVTWKYSYKKYGSQYTTWSTWKTTKNTSYTFNNLKKGTRYVFRAQYTYTSAVDGKTAVNSNYSVYKNIVVK